MPDSLSRAHGGSPMRVTPDIAADGAGEGVTPFAIGQFESGRWVTSADGGTSLSTPLIAGMQADLQQRLGFPIGFANPLIYARSGGAAYHDVTDHPAGAPDPVTEASVKASRTTGQPTDYLMTLGMDTSLTATGGYDDATGVGSPGRGYFVPGL